MNIARTAGTHEFEKYRADFPILHSRIHDDQALVYLDNAATTQRPRQVIDALVNVYEKHYANVHRGIHWLSDQSTDLFEETRELVRVFINAKHRHEVIFTNGTTTGINLVARSWGDENVREGDEILLTEMEHHANLVPWQQLAQRTGCTLKHIPITDDGLLRLDSLPQLLTAKTRLVSLAAVSNVLGTINDVDYVIQQAHAVGALTMVDAAQSVPHQVTDVQASGADFITFSGHKMLGPSGVGILYGREQVLDGMPPFLGGGSMIRRVRLDGFEPADLPAKFEAGTPPIAPAIGLGAAIEYVREVGCERIEGYERELTQHAHDMFAEISGVKMIGPGPEQKAGIVSFTMDGIHPHDVAQLLDRQGVAIRAGHHCAMPLHKRLRINASNRASFYFYNTHDEVERLGVAVQEVKRIFRRA